MVSNDERVWYLPLYHQCYRTTKVLKNCHRLLIICWDCMKWSQSESHSGPKVLPIHCPYIAHTSTIWYGAMVSKDNVWSLVIFFIFGPNFSIMEVKITKPETAPQYSRDFRAKNCSGLHWLKSAALAALAAVAAVGCSGCSGLQWLHWASVGCSGRLARHQYETGWDKFVF